MHPIAVAMAPKVFGVVALIRQQPAAALARATPLAGYSDLIKQGFGMRNIAGLSSRQSEAQGDPIRIAEHVNLGGEASATAAQSMI